MITTEHREGAMYLVTWQTEDNIIDRYDNDRMTYQTLTGTDQHGNKWVGTGYVDNEEGITEIEFADPINQEV